MVELMRGQPCDCAGEASLPLLLLPPSVCLHEEHQHFKMFSTYERHIQLQDEENIFQDCPHPTGLYSKENGGGAIPGGNQQEQRGATPHF